MRKTKEPWVQWMEDAKKAKAKVLRQLCTNCKRPLSEGGVSAYPGLCRKCVNSG